MCSLARPSRKPRSYPVTPPTPQHPPPPHTHTWCSFDTFVVQGASWDWSFAQSYLNFFITGVTILVGQRAQRADARGGQVQERGSRSCGRRRVVKCLRMPPLPWVGVQSQSWLQAVLLAPGAHVKCSPLAAAGLGPFVTLPSGCLHRALHWHHAVHQGMPSLPSPPTSALGRWWPCPRACPWR